MDTELSARLAAVRKEHAFSQEQLAEKMGLSRQAVSKWERGESAPDTQNLIALAKLYGMSLDELLGPEAPAHTEEVYEEPPVLAETPVPAQTKKEERLARRNERRQALADGRAARAAQPLLYPGAHRVWKLVPVWLIVPVLYFALGFMAGAWHPTWVLFLLLPVYFGELFALNARTRKEFYVRQPVFFASVFLFVLLGVVFGAWRFAWVLLFAAPVYHWVVRGRFSERR